MPPATPADGPRPLSRPARVAVIIGWSSFLAAALATMVCFAFVDPALLGPRMRIYAIGFFFFWFVGIVAAALSWSLANPRRVH